MTLSLEGDAGLFWVPAHLHPELAPGEFRNFLKSHTVDPDAETNDSSEAALARSPSWLARSRSMSGGLGRKKSMLSKQYQPRAGDNVEAERVPVRRGSLARGGGETGPSLRDLQKLEELVGDAEFADNPDKMREVLRRSLSQRMQPGRELDPVRPHRAAVLTHNVVNETTQGDGETEIAMPAPPRPGSIIRRTARTKIRKGPNDGSRRYSSSRRQRLTSPSQHTLDSSSMEDGGDRRSDERRSDETSEEASREGETFHDPSPIVAQPLPPVSDDNDEAMIFDAYARSSSSTVSSVTDAYDGSRSPSPDEHPPARERPSLAPIATPKHSDGNWAEDQELTPTQDASMSAALHAVTLLPPSGTSEDIFQSSPDAYADNYADAYASDEAYRAYLEEEEEEADGPAPPAKLDGQQQQQPPREQSLPPGMAPPLNQGTPPSMSTSGQQRVGPIPPALTVERPPLARTDSNSSTMSTASSTTSAGPLREKEKEKSKKGLFGKKHSKDKEKDKHKKEKDGFLGSLFGSKKKQEETSSVANFSTAGPAAAAALLGTSKSAKSLQASGTSSPTSPGFSNFARYPIHVERAVYRLSHIKLANARRPLIEQVLISNLMFWYLGVIGRAAGPAEDSKPGTVNGLDKDREEAQRSPPPKGTPPKSPDSGQFEDKSGHPRHQPQPESPSPSPTRKTGLVKPERSRVANNSEAAFRAPQYGMQNAQMEQEMRPALKQPHAQQQQHPIHHASPIPPQSPSPPPQQQQQPQQQHFQQAPAPTPRTSSMPSSPQRTLSPPAQQQQPQQPRQEYPPGMAPPRPQPFGPGVRPMPQGRPVAQHPPGAQPARPPQQPGVRPPPQQYPGSPQPPNGTMRPDRPIYSPYNDGGGGAGGVTRSSSQQRGAAGQPGQVFQYPAQYARPGHHGPQPGQIFTAQPGQIFHHPQYHQQQQRPPGAAPAQGWESVQRLPPGQQQGATLAQTPPRRTSSTSQSDPYGRQGYQREGGQTSPTHGSFYSQQRPAGQYQYPPGQARPQPVSSGQYPHHR